VTFYSERLLGRARELGLTRRDMHTVYPPVGAPFSWHDEAAQAEVRSSLGIINRHLLVNVKRLHPLAGQRYLIEAMNEVIRTHPDTRLIICGTGALLDELKSTARSAGVERHVTFAGLIDNATVARYCAAADLFVLPSILEALPTVAVEALAAGTPVVSADNPGGLELNDVFGRDVALVPREQPLPLAHAIVEFLNDKRRTGTATQDIVERDFRPSGVAQRYRALYADVMARTG
jgi:glycosyltransferase involved in cell wall biosynthesis